MEIIIKMVREDLAKYKFSYETSKSLAEKYGELLESIKDLPNRTSHDEGRLKAFDSLIEEERENYDFNMARYLELKPELDTLNQLVKESTNDRL